MGIKVLLDTDIGSDIDDAVCLAYLLANPDCELLGITTVTGEPVRRAMLASALCKVAGRSIPIYPGRSEPLLIPQMQTVAKQASALDRWDHEENFPAGKAISFMQEIIRSYPGEVVLLTIGPLSNVGALFAMDEEIPSMLEGMVSMCGVFTNRLAGIGPLEWNARGDPHATVIAYQSRMKYHRSIGLDVTSQVNMKAEDVERRFRHHLLEPVLDFARVWFKEYEGITFHDPLAAATIFDQGICKYERGQVEVELARSHVSGMTYFKSNPNGLHEVALEVNPQRFFDHYFSYFQKE